MASDINNVTIVGRLVRDAQMSYTNGGSAVANMAVAVNRRVKKGESWTDEVSFFDVVYFGKGAEAVNQYLQKGKQIAVQGELVQDRWETQEGQKRSRVNIKAQSVQLLGGRSDATQAPAPEATADFEGDISF